MAARRLKRYRIEGFPESSEFVTHHQLGLPFPGEEEDDELHSTMKLLGDSEHPSFWKYKIVHELIKPQLCRFRNIQRDKIIAIVEMIAYRDKNNPYIYLSGKSAYSDQFIKTIAESVPEFHAYERHIDMRRLSREIEGRIKGGWFSNLKIADVRTAGIFGERVADSNDWDRYDTFGTINAVMIELSIANGGLSILLSNDGGVVIYNAQGEREDLESLIQLDQIIADFVLRDDVAITL